MYSGMTELKQRFTLKEKFAVIILMALLQACGGGGSAGPDNSPQTGTVSFGISDAPVGPLSAVVITIDAIILNREGEDIVIDSFTSSELSADDSPTITLDLLQVQGLDNYIVIEDLELQAGSFQNIRLNSGYFAQLLLNLFLINNIERDSIVFHHPRYLLCI